MEKCRQPCDRDVRVEDVELAQPEVGEVRDAAVGHVARTFDIEQLERVAAGLAQNQDDLVRTSSAKMKHFLLEILRKYFLREKWTRWCILENASTAKFSIC